MPLPVKRILGLLFWRLISLRVLSASLAAVAILGGCASTADLNLVDRNFKVDELITSLKIFNSNAAIVSAYQYKLLTIKKQWGEEHPLYVLTLADLAQAQMAAGDIPNAIRNIDIAATKASSSSAEQKTAIEITKAEILEEAGKWSSALLSRQAALRLAIDGGLGQGTIEGSERGRIGRTLLALGRHQEAEQEFALSTQLFEKYSTMGTAADPEMFGWRGVNFLELSSIQKSLEMLRRAAKAFRSGQQFRIPNMNDRRRIYGYICDALFASADSQKREVFEEALQAAELSEGSDTDESIKLLAVRTVAQRLGMGENTRHSQDVDLGRKKAYEARAYALGEYITNRDMTSPDWGSDTYITAPTQQRNDGNYINVLRHMDEIAQAKNALAPSIQNIRASLRDDEVLVRFFYRRHHTKGENILYVFSVTKLEQQWTRVSVSPDKLQQLVTALRCGVDRTAWPEATCRNLLDPNFSEQDLENGKLLPFSSHRAFELYKILFGPIAHLVNGKQLLIVPSGPLTGVPFQLLVTVSPKTEDFRTIQWLIRDRAITVLPAVSSLIALRRVTRPSSATEPMVGFGNPLLEGRQDDPRDGPYFKEQAALARRLQNCEQSRDLRISAASSGRTSARPVQMYRGRAELSHLKLQPPLPETAIELCSVARDLKSDVRKVYLGSRATEREVKALSTSGELAKYRIVHFATHGALAGQLRGSAEPGLLLTPPSNSNEDDDGYLTVSEIERLRLDAELVVLSACNTAAGGGTNAEALSGLARAFFYAQARALLVSHWAVNSDATVKLITTTIAKLTQNKSIGRSEALRRAMLEMIDNGTPAQAHPSNWAPFVVVGEGAAGR